MDALRRRVDAHTISLRDDIAKRKVRSRATVQQCLVSFGIPLGSTPVSPGSVSRMLARLGAHMEQM
eukprot:3338672-Pleurochrysis_carterae.AAC.1